MDLPMGKLIYFSSLTVVIRCVIKYGIYYYYQVYLDHCLYQIQKMISYERINFSKGIDLSGSKERVKCMICGYSYFKSVSFKYQPYVCNFL